MKRVSLWTVWKLRLQLWWMFGIDEWKSGRPCNFRLKVRRAKGYWVWTCEVDPHENVKLGMHSRGEYALGPLQQWTLQEALSLAARKAEWVLYPDQEPVREPEPNPPVPKHSKMYRLEDHGKIAIECHCGWRASTLKCHPEQDSFLRCRTCAVAEDLYQQHFESMQTEEAPVSK